MSLGKPARLTPAKIAANRTNAQRSTRPRTAAGKGRIVFNALKHGRRSGAFRENLAKAKENVELFEWICAKVSEAFLPVGPRERLQAELLGRHVWCMVWKARRGAGSGTKPECPLKSTDTGFKLPSQIPPLRIRVLDARSRRQLLFWIRRRRGESPLRVPSPPIQRLPHSC